MKSIYTISPMIYKDRLPQPGETEYVISKYFYLFKVYHQSKDMINIYMNFIDHHFDNAFTNLDLRIVQFDYPDEINYASGAMTEYINEHYELSDESSISVESELNIQSSEHYLYGKFEVMFNGFSVWEIQQSGSILFDEPVSLIITVLGIYLKGEYRQFFFQLMKTILNYDEVIQEMDEADPYHATCLDSPYVYGDYFILYELKKFVETERRDLIK